MVRHTGSRRRQAGGVRQAAQGLEGISVFVRNEAGEVFHTYFTCMRGLDGVNGAYQFLDMVPKGRDEDNLRHPMEWLRRHDQY
jgi:predicted dithiol-disulfide oxidoreductase (DUF899 family)